MLPEEIILIDDASTDDTKRVVLQLAAESTVSILVEFIDANKGAAAARNRGWGIASKPYIAFLDADDTWHPQKLEIQFNFMAANPNLKLTGHLCTMANSTGQHDTVSVPNTGILVSPKSMVWTSPFSTPTAMIRREISFRFVETLRYCEDARLWQTIAFAGLPVARIDRALAYVHKPFFGSNGLSANMWHMEIAELKNFIFLYQEQKISLLILLSGATYSILKYARRIIISNILYGTKILTP